MRKRPVVHAAATFVVAVAAGACLAQAAAQAIEHDYRSWARTEPVAVVDFLSGNPQARTPEILAAAIDGWVEGNPAAAFARIPAVYESLTFPVVSAFADRWAERDPGAVAAAEFESRLLLSPAARQLATRLRSLDTTSAQ